MKVLLRKTVINEATQLITQRVLKHTEFSAKCRQTVGLLEFVSFTALWSLMWFYRSIQLGAKITYLCWTASELWSLRIQRCCPDLVLEGCNPARFPFRPGRKCFCKGIDLEEQKCRLDYGPQGQGLDTLSAECTAHINRAVKMKKDVSTHHYVYKMRVYINTFSVVFSLGKTNLQFRFVKHKKGG